MKGDGGHPRVAGDAAGVEVRQVVLIDALAHLDGQWNAALGRFLDRCLDDGCEEVDFPRKR
ncbi:hypothetical protein D3C73_1471430 [compost metagenome]